MSSIGFLFSRVVLGHNFPIRTVYSLKSVYFNSYRSFSSIEDALVDPKKSSTSANVDIVNYSLAGCFIVGYNEYGFQLSNAANIYGPMVSFPQNAFSWNISSAKDINEGSISLFRVLCPALEVLVIGKGAASEEINQREIMNMCWKHNLGVEILPTPTAIGVFNFLNAEGRYVAAGLIPPIRIDLFEGDKSTFKRLEAARDVQLSIGAGPKVRKLPMKESPKILKPLLEDKKFSKVYCIFAFVSFNAYVIIWVDDWLVGSAGSIINNSILIMMLQTNTVRRMMLSTSRKGSQRWRFMSTTMKNSGLEGPEEEKLIHPSLKNFVNRNAIAMQMPDMRRKYAISDAPLIPSYFLGKLQLELLEYPEMSTREEVAQANSLFTTVEDYMLKRVNSKQIDEQSAIPSDVLNDCKAMGLFGQRVNQKYGGLGMSPLESILIGEAMGYDPSLFATITVHEALAMKGLQLVGTDAQKEKYLPTLASGEKIASFCLAEASSGSGPTQSKTRATLSADGKHYILNGRKAWVVNGSRADVFTVFALTSVPNDKGEKEDKLSAFLVERGFEGTIDSQPALERIGLRGLDLVDVVFNDVKIPIENVLGELGSGAELSGRIACMERHLVGGLCIGMCRDVLDAVTEHCTSSQQMGRSLSDLGTVQHRLAQAAAQLYAMESVTYLVAGLLTAQPDRDLKIESSAVKLFTTETTLALLNSCANLFGAMGFTKKFPLERYLRDARVLTSFLGVNDMLRMYIASAGLSIAGKEMRQFVEYARQPSEHMFYMLREVMRKDWRLIRLRRAWSSPPAVVSSAQKETERGARVSTRISDHLHPNLRPMADRLSRIIIHTHEIARQVFIVHGNNPNEDQFSLWLLSDLAVGLLTVTAVLSRASRAKSIGVRYHNNELELAELFTLETLDRLEAEVSSFKQKANLSKRIASVMVKENGYASASPLTRVW